jgi:hypothetical protein
MIVRSSAYHRDRFIHRATQMEVSPTKHDQGNNHDGKAYRANAQCPNQDCIQK